MNENGNDLYAQVTAKIVADLEKGVRSWNQPWTNAHTGREVSIPVRHNRIPYRGVNILLLWIEAMQRGFASPMWMTYKQAQLQGGQVCKGERGSMVVFASPIEITETGETGEETERKIRLLRRYTVFNTEQIDGLPAECYPQPAPARPLDERIEAVDAFVHATGAVVRYGGDRAFYAPALDIIQMPPFERFSDREAYYGTLLHEITHWTSAETRLDRKFGQKRFGDAGYATEELVAELGAAFLCAILGITPEIREDHAAYIGNWVAILKEDNRAIFRAAAHAQRAADYLNGLHLGYSSPKPNDESQSIDGARAHQLSKRPSNEQLAATAHRLTH